MSAENVSRTYSLVRSLQSGYGFVVGHENPTIVKSIKPHTPADGKLRLGDIVVAINGIDVEDKPREQIINIIRLSNDQIKITVRQPYSYEELIRKTNLTHPRYYESNNGSANFDRQLNQEASYPRLPTITSESSQLNQVVTSISGQQSRQDLSATNSNSTLGKRSPLHMSRTNNQNGNDFNHNFKMKTQSYGRHSPLPQRCKSSAEKQNNDGDNSDRPQLRRSNTLRPMKSNLQPKSNQEILKILRDTPVMKIFFENGQTKVSRYDQETTVSSVLTHLNSKSGISEASYQYFGLTLEASPEEDKSYKRNKLHILHDTHAIYKIGQLPYASRIRVLYRMVQPPMDVSSLFAEDKIAFDYLYQQSCNDLRIERFHPELELDVALRLSCIHLVDYVNSNYSKCKFKGKDSKVYLDLVKSTPGVEHFLPRSLAKSFKVKKSKEKLKQKMRMIIKKIVEDIASDAQDAESLRYLNRYSSSSFHELSLRDAQLSATDKLKLIFMDYLSQLPCYGNVEVPTKSSSPFKENLVSDYPNSLDFDGQESLEASPSNSQGSSVNKNSGQRMIHMNSIRSLNSTNQVPSEQLTTRIDDMAPTPSIESVSSITFNPQNASPVHPMYYTKQMFHRSPSPVPEPFPMPRHQMMSAKPLDSESIDKFYHQRYLFNESQMNEKSIGNYIPPPPPSVPMFYDEMDLGKINSSYCAANPLTKMLSDRDIEYLRVPPPPKL